MGMVGCFRALNKAELQDLQADPSGVEDLTVEDDDENPRIVDIDKSWHAIHYLLTGSAEGGLEPGCLAVMGGEEIGDEVGYGPARLLLPEQVARVAALLEVLPPEVLAKRYNPKAMDSAGVYPQIWERDGDEGLQYILEWYKDLRTFYLDARTRGDGALLWLS